MIKKVTKGNPDTLNDQVVEDVFVLNLERAAQASIDIANLLISQYGLALPASYRQSFAILREAKIVNQKVATSMSNMAGFRNIAVHDYTTLNVNILKSILTQNLDDFETFYSQVYKFIKKSTV